MRILIFGGAGFVGLNIAQHCLAAGDDVFLFDRTDPPAAALAAFADLPGRLRAIVADVTDADAVAAAVVEGVEIVVLGAAITAGAQREASDPETILAVNLVAQAPILRAAARAGVRRVINLSSAAAYGAAGARYPVLDEETPSDPAGLYGITKWASERVGARLGELWGLDFVNLRLSGVFGPWERATGVRDTLSPHSQILAAAVAGAPALLQRPGLRDWIYAPDVGDAVRAVAAATPKLAHHLYNISTGRQVAALDWGQALISDFPGFVCRLVGPGEAATIDLHSATDRAPLATSRMEGDLDWRAPTGDAQSAALLAAWWREHGRHLRVT